MTDATDSTDRPALTSEVSISPAMIRAGEARLADLGGEEFPAAYVVAEVFSAMLAASPSAFSSPREEAARRK